MLQWIKKINLQKISYGFPDYTDMIFWTNAQLKEKNLFEFLCTERETDF